MRHRTLGKSDVSVSAVTMGCWSIVGDATWGPQDDGDSIDTIKAALDAGITTFDTAESYGDGYSEELLGKALTGMRGRAVLASKVSAQNLKAPDVKAACERSLARLRTDYIDLYQIHWPSREVPLEETMRALEELKASGKVRAIGVSNFATGDLGDLLKTGHVESDQLPYNMLFRAIEYGIQTKCAENGIGVMCYCPLAQGLLTGKFRSADDVPAGRARTRHFSRSRAQTRHGQEGAEAETFAAIDAVRRICADLGAPMEDVALAWLLAQPAVTTVVAGARHPEQARKNALAGDLELSAETVAALSRATEPLKAKLGPNPDMWLSQPRMR